ncbi:glucodextranase DOMON-like domain-containing protein [Halapricum hydrolyticum]|uniref:Alpha-amylase family glycosyl hydrolase n=1 Tax=Halapricum hydrolyticum TaxID=2979991 RepID=A0AAE3LDS5_9EURY|nr:glucodextranase DOMON-like domain-containing protein [Halapricum hydrolyticum]MCU4716844.1 alpha-amylase family glycosyl hydrolase [Halapricum hydrolyticum]MCU4725551.1 alpha-amylase family glycosyl hydrolase [Halapricum hydrolyticum]
MKRREYLTGLAGVGALSATGQVGAQSDVRRLSLSSAVGDDTHHPGAPRFAPLGVTFYDRPITDFDDDHADGKDRDSFAPQIVGEPEQDPANYGADEFSWSIAEAPDDSTATIEYRPADGDIEQYDPGQNNVAEFNPDVPGRYVLELDAPDGTHEQVLHIFPENSGNGGPPRISIEGEYDADAEEFVLDSNPKLAPSGQAPMSDVYVAWLADQRDALSTEDVDVGEGTDSWTARIPKSALDGETCRIHAAPNDGNMAGYADTVEMDPENEVVEYPNRPPEWAENGIMYQIFPRSFMGPPEEGEWPYFNSNAHFAGFEEKLDYLDDLNVDVIWFCPTVPSESANWKPQNADEWDGSGGNRFKFSGGGPHGYDALSYFQKAEDLTSEYTFEDYADEPWPWEEGYDPETNVREAARESAMAEFESFLEAAHERDIKVCIDFVINHGGRHHPLFQDTIASHSDSRPEGWTYKGIEANNEDSTYFDWFTRQTGPIEDDAGNVVDPAPAMTGFADLRVMPQWNYSNVALREHILAAAKHWAQTGVDAFRCDIAYGVPHGMWKEIREVVRAENSEFMLLDETIPNDPSFSENEFDMHFDTADFMTDAGHGVVNGGDPKQLYDSVAKRWDEGWPDHELIINATENHDEFRLLDVAQDGTREDPAKAQRAVWASGVLLPGIPFIYYGQERQITNYGYERFDYDGSGEDYRTGDGDVGPGNPARAFMNWEENGDEVPDEHLQFYKDVTQFYKDYDIFKPYAGLSGAWFQSEDSVLAFGRTMETDDGEQHVIVMLHFDPGTATVDLLPGAETEDWFSGEDIGVESEGQAVTVEFETLAVVETDSLFSLGDRVAQLDDETGDDNGPGSYTYPTGDYAEGTFDISEFTVHTTAENVQFRVPVAGSLGSDGDGGLTAQHAQIYLHDPEAEEGTTEGRAGTNVTFEEPYQYRVIANGVDGVLVENHAGEVVAEGSLVANPVADELVVEVPRSTLDMGIQSYYLAPLMFGHDADADGGVMQVQSEAGESAFGGAETPEMAPRVIDMVLPESTSQADALSYSGEELATLPYTSLASEFDQIGLAQDPEGDGKGPGNYQYAKPEGEFYDGLWDITSVGVSESRSRVQFEYTFATEIQNVWGLNGFSQQFPQVYIRDPKAGDDVPSSTSGRTGLNADFEEPYHYRVVVHGEGTQQVEAADGSVISTDVNVSVDGATIAFDLPKDAIGGSPEGKQLASLVAPYDGYGQGGIRQGFAAEPGDYTIGTSGEPTETAPRVMDLITPGDVSQSQALAYSADSTATIPLAAWGDAYVQTTGLDPITDPEGDDNGPGSYTYPTSDQIPEGCLDVTQVDIESKTASWDFTVHLNGPVENPWSYDDGFSPQLFQLYFQDPNAPEDAPATSRGRSGMTSSFLEEYHYRVYVDGGTQLVENAAGDALAEDFETTADSDASTISFSVPKAPFDTDDLTQMKMSMLVFSQDGFGQGGIRQSVGETAAEWGIGGANPDAVGSAPRVMDLVGPEGVVDQESALSYGPDSPALIPLYDVESLISGEGTSGLEAIAAPGPEVFGTVEGTLDASSSSDPDGQDLSFQWEQIGGPDVLEFNGTDTAKPTFVAPDVDEETELEFQVTVTNEDGDEATATTTATVVPQSANDAPTADAGEDQTVDPGETVSLQAVNSEDPNGGTLSYQWEQTAGPDVDLVGPDSIGAAFKAPEVEEDTDFVFELTVNDGQGKTATDSVTITVRGPEETETPTETETETETEEGDGFGPGFGVVSGALGTAGGVAYAAKSLLSSDEPAQPDDVAVEDVDDEE